jgi:hypothetical protein
MSFAATLGHQPYRMKRWSTKIRSVFDFAIARTSPINRDNREPRQGEQNRTWLTHQASVAIR